MKTLMTLMTTVFLLVSVCVCADTVQYQFDNASQKKLFTKLTNELRCLVCQNQNIADSNADLAKDLRQKTYEMVKQGSSRKEIETYMTDRYGDFVLYRPPFKPETLVLWLTPILLLLAIFIGLAMHRKKQALVEKTSLNDADKARVRDLLDSSINENAN